MSTTDSDGADEIVDEVLDDLDPETRTREYKDVSYGTTDAESIRYEYGLAPFSDSLYRDDDHQMIDPDSDAVKFPGVVPDCLIHIQGWERDLLKRDDPDLSDYHRDRELVLRWLAVHDDALQKMKIGGRDFLACGEPGSGKSTMALSWSRLEMEVNRAATCWRATPSRCEWIPFAPWAKVLVPAGYQPELVIQPVGSVDEYTVPLSEVAREVVHYETPQEIIREHLDRGKFHPIYPDPEFRGCEEFMAQSARSPEFEFRSRFEVDDEDGPPTPLMHWWFAFVVARVDLAPPVPTSLGIDEIGDLLPQDARQDDHQTYRKIETWKDAFVDARKTDFSIFKWGHNSEDVHDMARRKLRWRVTMPGWPNPTEGDNVVGMKSAPMTSQQTQYFTLGKGLFWNATNFAEFRWDDVPKPGRARLTVRFPKLDGKTRGETHA